ncbi:MAG: energy-coupling factor ABC transporter ATP-binding protein, partial [Acutalibacteraceae bacterium]
MSDQQQMIALRDYSFTYAMGIKPALRHISLEIQEGDFIVLCGASGSGKSTLLEVLKPDITPCGASEGAIETALSPQEAAIVFQDPESQLLTASVLSDLALPMENCGLPPQIMRRRMAETVSFFGLEHLLHKGPELLSGGEKQLVSLCAALMMQPRLLLLDEPTAQLDPIAARAFFDMLRRVHEELGITVVLAEHRLDEAAALCSSLMLLQNGEIRYSGAPEKVFRRIWREQDAAFLPFVPQLPLCSLALDAEKPLALTPPALRERIRPLLPGGWKKEASGTEPSYGKPVLFFRDVCFAYEKGEPVLQNLRMELR